MTLDTLRLTGIRGHGHHGVYDHERVDGQEFVVDVELRLDLRAAGASDDLADTVHYGELAVEVHDVITGGAHDLIETVAERIAQTVLVHKAVHEVTVTVHKPQAPITVPFDDVAVVITRRRDGDYDVAKIDVVPA